MLRQCAIAVLATLAAACAGPLTPAADATERYGQHCARQGHAPGSEGFRACVETEDINAQLAVQRDYDRKLLRRTDCVDPRIACDSPR
jgi:hypothetical protein